MTIKIIDRRTGEELSLGEFEMSVTIDRHLVFGWESYDHIIGELNEDNYEVTFPEVEELKTEVKRLKLLCISTAEDWIRAIGISAKGQKGAIEDFIKENNL